MILRASAANPARGLPEGLKGVPFGRSQGAAPVRVCLVFRTGASETPLVVLREELDAIVYLGCLLDAGGAVLEWLEIRVQNPDCLLRVWDTGGGGLTNADLDARWRETVRYAREHDRELLVATGWEEEPPPPLFIERDGALPWHPADPDTGSGWVLCREDRLLEDAGLPAYSTSAARYLYLPDAPDGSKRFLPVTEGAPAGPATMEPEAVFGDPAVRVPVNPWAGFVLVRRFVPTTLREYVEVLNGRPWDEVSRYPDVLPETLCGSVLLDAASRRPDQGRLFVAHHGLGVRLLETLYLKLLVFQSALAELRDATRALGRPLLNVTEESFRVVFGMASPEAPFLWSARALLAEAGAAVAVRVPGAGSAFASLSPSPAVPYAPIAARAPFTGSGSVRVRRVRPQADGVVLEGTLAIHGPPVEIVPSDLIRFRLGLGGRGLDLSARAEEGAALAENEVRFVTCPTPAAGEERQRLADFEGVRFPRVPFQVIPCLTTACDLYSAGVLACRVILQRPEARLAEVLDEVQALSHQLGREEGPEPLGARAARLAERDPRWVEVLGPHLLAGPDTSPEAAVAAVPAPLWWDLLAAIARLFPEMGPHSICRTFADVPPGGPHQGFAAALADFRDLGARVRSLLLNDFGFNREVRDVVRALLAAAETG